MSELSQDAARRIIDRLGHASKGAPPYYVAVGNTDGPAVNGEPLIGPIVFEQYLDECTLETARARLACKAMVEDCGGGRLARLDFDLGGDPSEPHVVVTSHDGAGVFRKPRGPLVWETYLLPGKATRATANSAAQRLESRYGACRIARLVFEDNPEFMR